MNCVYRDGDRLVGDNTDGGGFVDALRIDEDIDPAGMRCVGGRRRRRRPSRGPGARRWPAPREVAVVSSAPSRRPAAAALAGAVGVVAGDDDLADGRPRRQRHAGRHGRRPGTMPFDPAPCRAGAVIVDLVYHPADDTVAARRRAPRGSAPWAGSGCSCTRRPGRSRRWTGVDAPPRCDAPTPAAEALILQFRDFPSESAAERRYGSEAMRRCRGRCAVALQGTLETFSVPEVLRLLAGTKKTGLFALEGDRGPGTSGWPRVASAAPGRITKHGDRVDAVLFDLLRFAPARSSSSPTSTPDRGARPTTSRSTRCSAQPSSSWRNGARSSRSSRRCDVTVRLMSELGTDSVTVDAAQWRTLALVGGGATAATSGFASRPRRARLLPAGPRPRHGRGLVTVDDRCAGPRRRPRPQQRVRLARRRPRELHRHSCRRPGRDLAGDRGRPSPGAGRGPVARRAGRGRAPRRGPAPDRPAPARRVPARRVPEPTRRPRWAPTSPEQGASSKPTTSSASSPA